MDHLCYIYLVFVMLSCLFIAFLWSSAEKGLASWLSFVVFDCVCHFLIWYPGSSVVSFPDFYRLSYFVEILLFMLIL